MTEKIAFELKKGDTFKIKGKRKMYKVEDIFIKDYLTLTIYYKASASLFSKLKLSENEIVVVY